MKRPHRTLITTSLLISIAALVGVSAAADPLRAHARPKGSDNVIGALPTLIASTPLLNPADAQPAPTTAGKLLGLLPLPATPTSKPTSAKLPLPPTTAMPQAPLLPAPPPGTSAKEALPTATSEDATPGPGRAWTLTASTLKLAGSRYRGYALQDVDGHRVTTLHFTVDRLEITDLVQRGDLGNGATVHVSGAPASVSTVSNGPIELFTRRLTGILAAAGYPLAPVTLSPDSLLLPNQDLSFLNLPELTFRNAVVHNVDLSGGTLSIPGAMINVE